MEEHIIVSVGDTDPAHLQRGQVKHGSGMCVAILHGSPEGTEYMLNCREAHLTDYVFESLHSNPKSVEAALDAAFDKMDEKLLQEYREEAQAASGPFRHDLLWRSRDNSCVVVICEGIVYCMGYAEGRVVLCRRGKDYNLYVKGSPLVTTRIFLFSNPYSAEHRFHYFRKESLSVDDEFLFLATEIIWQCLDEDSGGLSPAFFTRVNAFGLVEAAKQIIGYERDNPKVLIAIPLVSTTRDWEVTPVEVPPSSEEFGQAPLIVPLIDGEPQIPEARASLNWTGCRYPPIVETGSKGLPDWICKPPSKQMSYLRGECSRCIVVMQLGNLVKWSINGEDDAIVNTTTASLNPPPDKNTVAWAIHSTGGVALRNELSGSRCAPGKAIATSAHGFKVATIIHTVGTRHPEKAKLVLHSCYESCLSLASKRGVKYIAFPAISCGKNNCGVGGVETAARVALDTVVSSEHRFGEIHFVFNDVKVLQIWADLFLRSSFDPRVTKRRMNKILKS